ncbi:MAG TPA: sugar phosphate isomerase/epimerase family protein [Rectinemataceae bacterium]|nr:sugar phosphate isomerase/epimerase family protein [Rectinemataceae bacterium]
MRYAICNELFGAMDFAASCGMIAAAGFTGIEIAPFTLGPDPSALGPDRVSALRRTILDSGLSFAGMHWLLAAPPGLHLASAEAATRRRTVDFLKAMCDLAGGLGGGMLVLGSPRQRGAQHVPASEALAFLREALAECGPHAAACGSKILLEALSSAQTEVVNLMSEAEAMVRGIGGPGLGCMLDFHNCVDEVEGFDALVDRHHALIRHVHLNDPDGGHPRAGDLSYLPAFRRLVAHGYEGWVSLEIFGVPEDPGLVLSETMDYLRGIEAEL